MLGDAMDKGEQIHCEEDESEIWSMWHNAGNGVWMRITLTWAINLRTSSGPTGRTVQNTASEMEDETTASSHQQVFFFF